MIDSSQILTIVSLGLTVVAGLLGKKYSDGLAKGEQLTKLLNDVILAAKDNTVTEAEFQTIVDDAKALLAK